MSKADTESGVIRFRALQLANEHRNAYGLRSNDYTRYRNHCTNRTHRLRSTLKMTHGKGRDFKKLPPITLENIKAGNLQLLLFEAERAWSYSQELYTKSLEPANKDKSAKLRHSATGRFRRAIHWCTQLLTHCQSLYAAHRLSASDMLEISAYTLILSGRFLRFRDEYEDARDQLCVARSLLDVLADAAQNSRDQALATLFADSIAPEIRYCAHQLGQADAYDIDRIVKEVAPSQRDTFVVGYGEIVSRLKAESDGKYSADERKRLHELIWEGQPIPVRHPELVDVLLKVQEAEKPLKDPSSSKGATEKGAKTQKSRKGVAAFDAVLAALSDAEEVARKLIESQRSTASTSTSSGTRDIHFLHAYIVYQLLSRRIQRDLTLVSALISSSSTTSPRKTSVKQDGQKVFPSKDPENESTDARVNPAVVKILDTVLQSLTHMRTLSIVDESPDLASAIETRLAYTKSKRCLYLSRSYAAVKQYAQALSLIQRSQLSLRESTSFLSQLPATSTSDSTSTLPINFYALTPSDLSQLGSSLDAEATRLKRAWFAHNGGSIGVERDTEKKPLFFDIALNYVQLDMDQIQKRAGAAVKETKAGTTQKGMSKSKSKSTTNVSVSVEPKSVPAIKAKAEEIERSATPEPGTTQRGGLSSLLGGWWGRK